MSDGEVLVSGGEVSESGDEIFDELPPWMPRDESTGNFKLLDVAGRAFDRIEGDIDDVDDATSVQNAQTIEQLEKLAQIVDVNHKSEEHIEKYRRRVIGGYQNTTNEGDLPSLFENISELLEIDITDIGYLKGSENGAFVFTVPSNSIDGVSLTKEEFNEIISEQVAAGFRPDIQTSGTFTFITPIQYGNDDHDATKGYDGLDSNGDPKDNGGTYAGVLS
jgi:hypothetical protein